MTYRVRSPSLVATVALNNQRLRILGYLDSQSQPFESEQDEPRPIPNETQSAHLPSFRKSVFTTSPSISAPLSPPLRLRQRLASHR